MYCAPDCKSRDHYSQQDPSLLILSHALTDEPLQLIVGLASKIDGLGHREIEDGIGSGFRRLGLCYSPGRGRAPAPC